MANNFVVRPSFLTSVTCTSSWKTEGYKGTSPPPVLSIEKSDLSFAQAPARDLPLPFYQLGEQYQGMTSLTLSLSPERLLNSHAFPSTTTDSFLLDR